jgi:hypothetical protein
MVIARVAAGAALSDAAGGELCATWIAVLEPFGISRAVRLSRSFEARANPFVMSRRQVCRPDTDLLFFN